MRFTGQVRHTIVPCRTGRFTRRWKKEFRYEKNDGSVVWILQGRHHRICIGIKRDREFRRRQAEVRRSGRYLPAVAVYGGQGSSFTE